MDLQEDLGIRAGLLSMPSSCQDPATTFRNWQIDPIKSPLHRVSHVSNGLNTRHNDH